MDPTKWKTIKSKFSAMLDLSADERSAFLQDCDDDIKIEVEKLLKAYEKSEDFIEKPLLIEQGIASDETEDGFVGKRIENYQILERLGTGGMGAVYLAERLNSDFKQKVALKIIKRGMDSEAVLQRFANERRILSSLTHPNIAQLLDGGISSEGLSFFVMEFVDGKPLNQFCDEKELSVNERLQIFQNICSPVEHAHKNLIIHRDLKPSNILVKDDGIPKLLDFGISKLLSGENAEITITQAKAFTPEYASPEQILGKTVTTSTDVYSLGIILYELLSGHRPFETKGKSYEEIVKSICETAPPRPSSMISSHSSAAGGRTSKNEGRRTKDEGQPADTKSKVQNPKSLQGDLDNIILKAINKEPAERYGSVHEFSADISRFLNGLPVWARSQTLKYKFGKYVKRHKTGVLAAALVLLSLLGGISIAIWQAQIARLERAKAERRFDDVRGLSKSVMFELHKAIQDLPGSTAARELLVTKSLEYLDKLALEEQTDSSLQMELAEGYDQMANIQGGFNANQLGQREKALESYQKALAIREKLVAAEPKNIKFRQELGSSYFNIGNMYYIQAKMSDSLNMVQKSIETLEGIQKEAPDNSSIKTSLANAFRQESIIFAMTGKIEEGCQSVETSLKLAEEVANENPNVENLRLLASNEDVYANFLVAFKKDYDGALNYYQKSYEISRQLLATQPNNTTYQRNVAVSYSHFTEFYFEREDYQSALTNAQKAREIFAQIQNQDPKNEEIKTLVSKMDPWISKILITMGKPSDAIPGLNNSLKELERQYAESPADKEVYFQIGVVKMLLGLAYKPVDTKKSCQYFQKTYQMYQEFLSYGYSNEGGFNGKEIDQLKEEVKQCGK